MMQAVGPGRTWTVAVSPISAKNAEKDGARSYLHLVALAWCFFALALGSAAQNLQRPPRAAAAERFLARRGWVAGKRLPRVRANAAILLHNTASTQGPSSTTWSPIGPAAVLTPNYGLVSGRVTSIALDPADTTGNHVYVGTTGGGVWVTSDANVAAPAVPSFIPLTDSLSALGGAVDAGISIGAVTVQPGGTGVILAGTGDPNDVLDSYYGAGILRSADNGQTWTLIPATVDLESGIGNQDYSFAGEGFAGFAWSTVNPQVVVAAVSQAYEGTLVNAVQPGTSLQGLYYSNDSGTTWHLATISDGGDDVQGPRDRFPKPDGNAATAVVWNSQRGMFIAAVRYHGYYQSTDGVTWTRMAAQPGAGLTASACPTNAGAIGSIACPIFRGALAVNPYSGDTFAWTVDANEQDQGLWQDQCNLTGGACVSPSLSFSQQWSTALLESNTSEGQVTIAGGAYSLTLAALPAGNSAPPASEATMVLAGASDLWQSQCPLSQGCQWRNTTNSTTCMSAKVGEFQLALAWNAGNPLEIFVGNDSGLWRSSDEIAESGGQCDPGDANHFANLNGGLGSLAEVESLSQVTTSPYTLLAGLGANGATGVKSGDVVADWPQVLGGYGGPVAVDPIHPDWYVNDQAGVAVYHCSQSAACTPADFGASPVVTNADVGGDGDVMPEPAQLAVDPIDSSQLLVATCRVWRGPNTGGWSAANAISPILDNPSAAGPCQGDALIRSMAVATIPSSPTQEVIYVGMYGSANGGSNLPGHVLSAALDLSSDTEPVWRDLTVNSSVANDSLSLNSYGFDVSSVVVDSHDATGRTAYVTVAGITGTGGNVQTVYRSTNGGATWNAITSNLPKSPANALAIDPGNANTVYVATDAGVYYTTEVGACAQTASNCWSAFGSGLPQAPVVALSAAPAKASSAVLVAATYGRGIWQTPLWTSQTNLSAASVSPASHDFQGQVYGTSSTPQTVTLINTGSTALTPTSIAFSGDADDFSASQDCVNASVAVGASCPIKVTFTPQATGPRTAVMTIYANIYGGQITVDLNGEGLPGGSVTPSNALSFGQVKVGSTSTALAAWITNSGASSVTMESVTVTTPFVLASNSCTGPVVANGSCNVQVEFAPTQTGAMAGTLTFTDSAGVQTVALSGTGAAAPTDVLSANSLAFPDTPAGQVSAAQSVTITNNGDLPLHVTSITASANFQQSSNCLSGVAAQTSCSISVQFAPTQAGNLTGQLTIIDELGTKTVALSGTGLQPGAISVSPAGLSFSLQQPGVASAPQTVTITNSGGAVLAGIGFQITGPAAASYALAGNTCEAQLAIGASCSVQVTFTPSATGPIAAVLAISSSTTGVMAASVPLNGSGQLASGLAANPVQLPFATVVGVGQSSAAQAVIVTNSSGYAIGAVALAATGPFTLTQNTCTGGLAAGANCTAGVIFAPAAGGAAAGTLTVTSSVVTAPATIALSGTGFDFTVQASGATSQTVTSGQQAVYKLSISPNGAAGTFTFQCGTLPANALCIFNPGSESLNVGVAGSVEVQIYTGNTGATARMAVPARGRVWPLAFALVLLPLALRGRRRWLLVVLFGVLVSAGVSSCTSSAGGTIGGSGSGTGGQGSANSTPAGTYTIPVTVTSTGVSRSVTLTMTVD